jgi:CRP/FNR family transcriptional regulator, cyclic AMP receptor protein
MLCHFKKDQVIFSEEDSSNSVYRVVSGTVEVTRRSPSGTEAFGVLKPGDFLGEIGVLIACRRSGTAKCLEDAALERFTRVEFLDLIAKDRALGTRLLAVLSLRTRAQIEVLHALPDRDTVDRMRRRRPLIWFSHWLHELFVPLNEFIRRRVKSIPFARTSKEMLARPDLPIRKFAKGESIFEEGQNGASVFWIQSGKVNVFKRVRGRQLRVAKITSNEFIGEMSVLESLPRSATAIAVTDVITREISLDDFFKLLNNSPSIYLVVIDSLCERVRRLRRIILDLHKTVHPTPSENEGVFEAARSVESVAQLAEQRLMNEIFKMRRFFNVQLEHGKYIAAVYQKYLRGEAKREEMDRANNYFRDYLKMAGLSTLFILPGAPLSIPLAVKIGKALGVDIFPAEPEYDLDETESAPSSDVG